MKDYVLSTDYVPSKKVNNLNPLIVTLSEISTYLFINFIHLITGVFIL